MCVCLCACRPLTFPISYPHASIVWVMVSWCSTGVVLSAVVNGMWEVREAGVNYLLHINGQQRRSVWRSSLLHTASKNVTFPKSTEWEMSFFSSSFYLFPPPPHPTANTLLQTLLSFPFMASSLCKCRLSTFFICKLDNLRSDEQTVPV